MNNAFNSAEIIIKQFNYQTRLFKNAIEGIDEQNSLTRLYNKTNNLRWIAGHLIVVRYRSITRMNVEVEQYPHYDKFTLKDATPPTPVTKAFDDSIEYPPLSESRKYWDIYSETMMKNLALLNNEQLSAGVPFEVPIGGNTLRDLLAFIATHECYHIGQMSIIRKALGYPPMILK